MESQPSTASGPAPFGPMTASGAAPRRPASLLASERRWMSSCEWAWISEARQHFQARPNADTERGAEPAEPIRAVSDRMRGLATG